MPKVFANVCKCVCDILNAVFHFARDVRHFAVCKNLEKKILKDF